MDNERINGSITTSSLTSLPMVQVRGAYTTLGMAAPVELIIDLPPMLSRSNFNHEIQPKFTVTRYVSWRIICS